MNNMNINDNNIIQNQDDKINDEGKNDMMSYNNLNNLNQQKQQPKHFHQKKIKVII